MRFKTFFIVLFGILVVSIGATLTCGACLARIQMPHTASIDFLTYDESHFENLGSSRNRGDTMADSRFPDKNYGTWVYMDVDWELSPPCAIFSYISWDLSSIPSNATVTSAKIYLYAWAVWTNPLTYVWRTSDSWNENTLTWNNKPDNIGPSLDYQMMTAIGRYSWNITAAVQSSIMSGKISLIFRSMPISYSEFYTKEKANSLYTPYLEVTYITQVPPSVTTNPTTDVTGTSATLNGNLDSMGSDSSATVWFQWGRKGYGYEYETTHQNKTATGPFSDSISGLSPGTTYHFRAVAQNSVGPSYGSDHEFTTFNFALSKSGDVTVTRGSSGSTTITASLLSGPTQLVSLSGGWVGSTPSGVTPGLSPTSGYPTFGSTLTITTSLSASIGTFTYRITGTGGGVTRTVDVNVYIQDFTVGVSPTSGTITPGRTINGAATITVTALGGYNRTVTLSASGAPSGVTISFSPSSGIPTFSSSMNVSASPSAPTGTYTITITGMGSDSAVRTTTYTLTIWDFSVSVSPPSGSVVSGDSINATVTVNALNGYNLTVTLSASGLPSGASVSFNPTSGTPTFNSTMKISTSSSTPTGTYTITITGTGSDSTVRTTNYTLEVGDVVYRAVIVGISDYAPAGPGGPDLNYCDDDANDMYAVLLSYANWDVANVRRRIDTQATRNNIQAAIQWAAANADVDDVFVFFYSGHGTYGPDLEPFDELDGLDEYILPHDLNYIRDDELKIWLDSVPGRKIVILDSCFSGGFDKGLDMPDGNTVKNLSGTKQVNLIDDFSRDLNGPGYVVLTACDEDELSYESGTIRNGYFTYYVVEGLWGPADINADDIISAEETFSYAAPRTTNAEPLQHPQLYDDDAASESVISILAARLAPSLLSPALGALINDTTPTFEWSAWPGADNYELQYATDFLTNPVTISNIRATSYTLTTPLADATWFWRVRAGNNVGDVTDWSEVWLFTLDATPPPMPELFSPPDNALIHDDTPTFEWTRAQDNSGVTYTLQYSTDNTFQTATTVGGIVENTYTVPDENALADNTYYWRVQAKDGAGNVSNWSQSRTVTVEKIVSFTLNLRAGWNMVSFPVQPDNVDPDSTFPEYFITYRWNAASPSYVLCGGSPVEPDEPIAPGVGYWVFVSAAENVAVSGTRVDNLTLSLSKGWNLIGLPLGGGSIADPDDDPDNSVLQFAYTWQNGSYVLTTDNLVAGAGYWVFAMNSCVLRLPGAKMYKSLSSNSTTSDYVSYKIQA